MKYHIHLITQNGVFNEKQLSKSTDYFVYYFTHKKEIFNALLRSGNTFHVLQAAIFINAKTTDFKSYEIHLIGNFIDRFIK